MTQASGGTAAEVARLRPAGVAAPAAGRPLVVFVGVDDDARSRLAAALVAHRSRGRVQAVSLAPRPVPPDVTLLRVLAEVGVDLRPHPSARDAALLDRADLVVVMGYDGQVELPAGRRSEDWCIDDPRGKPPDVVRHIRDALDRRATRLLARLGVGALLVGDA
jgi:protein-tyrosine-phosphatase